MNFLTFSNLKEIFDHLLGNERIYELSNIPIYENNPTKTIRLKSQQDFLYTILPKEMYILSRSATYTLNDLFLPNGENRSDEELDEYINRVNKQSRSTMSHFFNYDSSTRYEQFSNLLLRRHPRTNNYYSYTDSPYRLYLSENWNKILSKLTPSEQENLRYELKEKINYITRNHEEFHYRFQKILSESIADCLTTLTLIACTISYFENSFDSEMTRQLNLIVFPIIDNLEPNNDDIDKLREKDCRNAKQLLKRIEPLLSSIETNPSNNQRCLNQCMSILLLEHLTDSFLLGKVNYILYLCHQYPPYIETKDIIANNYLDQSFLYGYQDAINKKNNDRNQPLIYRATEEHSSAEGICILNCKNIYTSSYIDTMPKTNWKIEMFEENSSKQLEMNKIKKYLFFSNDYNKNLTDTLILFDAIRSNNAYSLVNEIEVYIRCREESYDSLVDTAQSHMKNHVIKIYLLDDEKFAAQYLLSHHPLFYPIRSLSSKRKSKDNIPLLNFVIIGSDECAEWLVREASWIMTFLPDEVTSKITILAPDADRLYTDITTKCPGLRKDNLEVNHLFKEKVVCDIDPQNRMLDSYELENTINQLISTNSHLYFAISCGNDEKNLKMGIRIREQLIRNIILNNNKFAKKDSLYDLPPIAFRCKDSNIAELAKHLIVNNINHGDRWYNNYALIPFGSYSTRYNWKNLDGGLIHKYALCIHMEYNDVPIDDTDGSQQNKIREAINSYYLRQYNRDSSSAVALSLPYRLFNIHEKDYRLALHTWNILDDQSYYNENILSSFSEATEDLQNKSNLHEDIIRLSNWEQLRWSRYMLARGWMPVSTDQTKLYVDSEYTKHQLYIAKLHPAICGFEKLKNVEKALGKSFQTYNIRNLKNTHLILERKWLKENS